MPCSCPCSCPWPFPCPCPCSCPCLCLCPYFVPKPHPSPALTYWGQGVVCVWFGIPFLSDFGTFLVTILSILGVGVPKGARVPKRVKNGHTKPKESIPKWSPFWDRFPTCCAQFFHHFLGTLLRRLFDHLWSPRAPNWDPFGDHFGDFWGQGCKSAKRTLAAARALFSTVQGVKFGIH